MSFARYIPIPPFMYLRPLNQEMVIAIHQPSGELNIQQMLVTSRQHLVNNISREYQRRDPFQWAARTPLDQVNKHLRELNGAWREWENSEECLLLQVRP